jgi:hypothetical protein
VLLLGVSLWQLVLWRWPILAYCNWVLLIGCVAVVLLAGWRLFTTNPLNPTQMMPGAWGAGQTRAFETAAKLNRSEPVSLSK